MANDKKQEKWYHKLRHQYRLVIFHDETFEEKLSFRLTRLNVFVLLISTTVLLIVGTIYLIAFTSLREYIPGYTDVTLDKRIYSMELTIDSLEQTLLYKERYLINFKRIINGDDFLDDSILAQNSSPGQQTPVQEPIIKDKSLEDSLLRLEFEAYEQYNLIYQSDIMPESKRRTMLAANFFTPLKGTVSNKFDHAARHYGTDIVAKSNESIKATLEGVVVYADWTIEKGYVIGIQHEGNFFSVYKHNSTLLKKEGDFVRAGEAIAIIGETGELSTGPHLHFELWFNGTPLNPEEYMTF